MKSDSFETKISVSDLGVRKEGEQLCKNSN